MNDFPISWNYSHCFSFPDVAGERSVAVQHAREKQSAWVAVLPERAVELVAERSAYAVWVVIALQVPVDETSAPGFALRAVDDESSEPVFELRALDDERSEPAFERRAPGDERSEPESA